MEYFPIIARRPPQDLAPGLAAIASHPGALAALRLDANGHGGDVYIDPQQALGEAMMRRLAIALEIIPGHPTELVNRLHGTRVQGAGDGRLLGTARPAKSPLHGWIHTNRGIALGDGLGPTEDAQQGIEHLLDGAMADCLLGNRELLAQGSKKALPPQILPQGTQARTAGWDRDIFCHGVLLPGKGLRPILDLSIESIPL